MDFLTESEKVIKELKKRRNLLTTSKIRSVLSMCSNLYNEINIRNSEYVTSKDRLNKDAIFEIKRIIMRIYYEYGRDEGPDDDGWKKIKKQGKWKRVLIKKGEVKDFIDRSNIIIKLKSIHENDPVEKYIDFYHYLESLVAFHKYYGGKEN